MISRNKLLHMGLGVAVLFSIAWILMATASAEEQSYPYYPCTACHATMDLRGDKKFSPLHGIDLREGAHKGLYCMNCHVAPIMQELAGGAEVYIPGVHPRDKLVETNKVCAVCHPREYRDYHYLVHGNKTYTCEGGNVSLILGYKGVVYSFHECPEYRNLETTPARACVECHDPHDPTLRALNPLPEPSTRPPPPFEASIAAGTFLAFIGGLGLVVAALVLPLERRR